VQIDPEHDRIFGGCLMVVTEPKSWGAQGYFLIPGALGAAYYRCEHDKMTKVGRSHWMINPDIDYPQMIQVIS